MNIKDRLALCEAATKAGGGLGRWLFNLGPYWPMFNTYRSGVVIRGSEDENGDLTMVCRETTMPEFAEFIAAHDPTYVAKLLKLAEAAIDLKRDNSAKALQALWRSVNDLMIEDLQQEAGDATE